MASQEVPSMVAFFMTSEYDWRYKTKPKENIAGMVQDRKMLYPRGYTLGGSRFAGSPMTRVFYILVKLF